MPRRIKIDGAKLAKTIKDGTPQAEVMKKFGFKNATQLKVAYANALMDSGKAPAIKSGRKATAKAKAVAMSSKVNMRGSLVIPKAAVEKMGFAVGEGFQIRKTKAGISLKKV